MKVVSRPRFLIQERRIRAAAGGSILSRRGWTRLVIDIGCGGCSRIWASLPPQIKGGVAVSPQNRPNWAGSFVWLGSGMAMGFGNAELVHVVCMYFVGIPNEGHL